MRKKRISLRLPSMAPRSAMPPAGMPPASMGMMPMVSHGSFIKNKGYGDVGVKRQQESVKVGGFKAGHIESAEAEFAEGGDSNG